MMVVEHFKNFRYYQDFCRKYHFQELQQRKSPAFHQEIIEKKQIQEKQKQASQ